MKKLTLLLTALLLAALAACSRPEPPPAPEPPVRIVDFVCEQDVREAIAESRKIFIGPKTIVTPSAREAAGGDDILVLAERPDYERSDLSQVLYLELKRLTSSQGGSGAQSDVGVAGDSL